MLDGKAAGWWVGHSHEVFFFPVVLYALSVLATRHTHGFAVLLCTVYKHCCTSYNNDVVSYIVHEYQHTQGSSTAAPHRCGFQWLHVGPGPEERAQKAYGGKRNMTDSLCLQQQYSSSSIAQSLLFYFLYLAHRVVPRRRVSVSQTMLSLSLLTAEALTTRLS